MRCRLAACAPDLISVALWLNPWARLQRDRARASRDRICLVKLAFATIVLATLAAAACARSAPPPLIPATTTMVTAWQIPHDPLNDPSLADPRLGEQIKWGYRIFTETPREAPRLAGGKVSCSNCHLNAS